MRMNLRLVVLSLLLALIVPGCMMLIAEKILVKEPKSTMLPSEVLEEGEVRTVLVKMQDGRIEEKETEAYLVSVLLREMPSDFELEALKAQAVVARTYLLRRYEEGGRHDNAHICADSSCCQAYWDIAEYLAEGGEMENVEKMRKAVTETANEVLRYQGALIDATYFSCSGGRTEDAVAVWGSDVPYLQSVESPGEESAKVYVETVSVAIAELMEKLQIKKDPTGFSIDEISYTKGGGIDTIQICGTIIKGTTLRNKLKLNSTAMQISVVGECVTITTKGKGHRVGMSQYGADAMAKDGAGYKEILAHYYVGTNVDAYNPD